MSTENTNLSVKQYFAKPEIEAKLAELVGAESKTYIMSALNVVNNNTLLATATPKSILNAVLMAAVLGFPINNNLGYAYVVPYGKEAQFQIGYKGFIQLAIRSGNYKYINATPVFKGQLIKNDPLSGFQFDFSKPKIGNPIGYASEFLLKNGFQKTVYMTMDEILAHGKKYSKTFDKEHSTWKKDLHGMCMKTVIKPLLSKWGVLSMEMRKAIESDQSVIEDLDTNKYKYPDNDGKPLANDDFEEHEEVGETDDPSDEDLL